MLCILWSEFSRTFLLHVECFTGILCITQSWTFHFNTRWHEAMVGGNQGPSVGCPTSCGNYIGINLNWLHYFLCNFFVGGGVGVGGELGYRMVWGFTISIIWLWFKGSNFSFPIVSFCPLDTSYSFIHIFEWNKNKFNDWFIFRFNIKMCWTCQNHACWRSQWRIYMFSLFFRFLKGFCFIYS